MRKYNTKNKTKKRNNLRTNRKNKTRRRRTKNKTRKRTKNKQKGGFAITSVALATLIPFIKGNVIPKLSVLLKYGLQNIGNSKCKAYAESVQESIPQDSTYSMENIETCSALSSKITKDISHIIKTKGAKPFIKLLLDNLKNEFKEEHLKMNDIHGIKEFFKDILNSKKALRFLQVLVVTLIESEKLSNKEMLDDNNEDLKSSLVKGISKKMKDIFNKDKFSQIGDITEEYERAMALAHS